MFFRDAFYLLICTSVHGLIQKCPDYQVHFEKILGFRPTISESSYEVKILYKSYHVVPTVINSHCMNLCKLNINCESYVLNFNKSECYGFSSNERMKENLNYHRVDDNELVEDLGVIFFVKTCLTIPLNCKTTLWPLLRIPGASLIGRGYLTINKLLTRRECIERCLFETSFKCRSVSFQISQRNNIVRMGLSNILNKDVLGQCIMSRDDKNNQPDSFRVAPLNEEYIENNCQVAMNGENEQFFDDLCAYEHFPGSALMYAEQLYIGLSDRQCQERCFKEHTFFCKGITFRHSIEGTDSTHCFIHSEDVMSIGPRALIAMPDAYYFKRVQCLNLNVRCTQADMIIRYSPRNYFQGRIYAENHPDEDECAISGSGKPGPTFLTLPIDSKIIENRCGVSRAFDYESPNRTLIYVYIIIQQNPLVQMQTDRYIKVGCISNTPVMPDPSVPFNTQNYDSDGTLVIDRGFGFEIPKLSAYIADPLTEDIVSEARIGQNLKLIVSMDSRYESYDLKAINLTATSDNDRLELINIYGCPINSALFPAFHPERTESSRRLTAEFKAFKFATSQQLKLSLVIQFCYVNCIPRNCGKVSHGRKKRENLAEIVNKSPTPHLDRIIFPDEKSTTPATPAAILEPVKFPELSQKLMMTDNFGNPKGIQQYFENKVVTFPLDITVNVLETNVDGADRFVIGENDHILVGSLASSNTNLCLDESLIIAILIFWLIFQVLIILGCCIMINRYRKMTAYDDTGSFNSVFYPDSLDNRHVRWADQRSIHDTYFQ